MSPVEQLRLVERYLTPFRGRLISLADVYLAVFRGFIVKGGYAPVLAPLDKSSREQLIYSLNKWLDFDGNGKITKGELALAALAIGRFQPTTQRSGVSIFRKPMEATDRKTESPQTRSIYIR
jgi:hypothetical protein